MNNSRRAWAATLTIGDEERLESRVLTVLREVRKNLGEGPWRIDDLDATGRLGHQAASRRESNGIAWLHTSQLIDIFAEDGQVIEFQATLNDSDKRPALQIIIRDGVSVDVLGVGDILDIRVLGEFVEVEPELFLWPS